MWQKNFGSTLNDTSYSIEQTTDGGYVIAGFTSFHNGDVTNYHQGRDFWIVKTDASGNLQWQKALGGSGTDVAFTVMQTTDNGYIVTGHSNSPDGDKTKSFGNEDIWILKLDDLGNLQWQKSFGTSKNNRAFSAIQTTDGGYILVGDYEETELTFTHREIKVIKLTANGELEWENNYGYVDNSGNYYSTDDYGRTIIQTTDGGYILTGSTLPLEQQGLNYSDAWVIKLNALGNVEWNKRYGGSLIDFSWDIKQTSDGGYVLAGYTSSTDGDFANNNGGEDYWVVKIDASGNLQWQKTLGGSKSDRAFSARETTDNGYIISGYTQSNDGDITNSQGSFDGWVVKLDINGDLLWQKVLGGSDYDIIRTIVQTSDGGYIATGNTKSNDAGVGTLHGDYDFWVIKFGEESLKLNDIVTTNSINIYPNPVSKILTISSTTSMIKTIELYDLLGRLQLSTKQNKIDVSHYQSGVYLLKILSDKGYVTKKIVIK